MRINFSEKAENCQKTENQRENTSKLSQNKNRLKINKTTDFFWKNNEHTNKNKQNKKPDFSFYTKISHA